MGICLTNHIALDLHIHHHEVGTIEAVGHDTAHESSSQYYSIWLLLIEEFLYCILIGEVEFLVTSTYEIIITTGLEVVPDSGTDKTIVSCNINFTIFIHIKFVFFY